MKQDKKQQGDLESGLKGGTKEPWMKPKLSILFGKATRSGKINGLNEIGVACHISTGASVTKKTQASMFTPGSMCSANGYMGTFDSPAIGPS
ncbi:MAG: hypothetical protein GY696_09550 [Gammaproteobacteria bacterium]|nr:hypothetical protein [Gammaproteobacteria bacterium]